MKKFYIILLLFIAHLTALAQCNPCPNLFSLKDNKGCFDKDLLQSGGSTIGSNYGNTDTTQFEFCENSLSTLCIKPLPVFAQGVLCNYDAFAIDSITVSGGTLISNTAKCFTIQWDTVSNAVVTIYFTIPNSNGASCRGEIILYIKLLDAPIATFTANPQPACFSNPTAINFNSAGTIGAATYFWDFGDGFTGVGDYPAHNYYAAGNYAVCLYASSKPADTSAGAPAGKIDLCPGCIDTFCSVITIDSLPPPDINCVNTVCAGQKDKYCTSAASCSAYNWSVIGGTIISGAGTNCITVQWGSGSPQGSISLNVSGCTTTYCSIGNTVTVPIIPTAAVMTGNVIVCQGELENYNVPILPATTYSWNIIGAGGTIVNNNTNTPSIAVLWNTVGTFTVECIYTNTALSCGGQSTKVVTVLPKLKILGINSICEATTAYFNSVDNIANTPITSAWSVSPAGATITGGQNSPNVIMVFNSSGTFTITANGIAPTPTCQTETYIVTVYPAPIITAIDGDTNICANSFKNYKVVSSNNTGYFIWTITNGTYIPLTASGDSLQINWGATGPYNIAVVQVSAQNCVSNSFTKTYLVGATPTITGPTNVCADAITTYTLSSPAIGNFTWYVTPAQYGTILTGQGTNIASVQWSGINAPGGTNTVYLHYGFCGSDSIAIIITDPSPITITQSGTLCGAGITLSTAPATSYIWSCVQHPISPVQSNTNPTLVSLNLPGTYNVSLINVNGTGCNATATKILPPVGLPVANISTAGPINFCFPSLPNIVLSAGVGAGYSYQWFLNSAPVGTGTTLNVNNVAPCNITTIGSYVFTLQVTKGGCTAISNPLFVIVDSCTSNPNCVANIVIDSIKFCNPFDVFSTITAPGGGIPTGIQDIFHYEDLSSTSGNTTKTFTSGIGYKLIRVCKNITLPSTQICTACKDTSVLVTVSANYIHVENCGKVNILNTSQVVAPSTITSYNWTVGSYPSNSAVPPIIASFNNPSLANPVLTITIADTFLVTLTVTASNGCTSTKTDTIVSRKADAGFSFTTACLGSPTSFASTIASGTHTWAFGDASASYINPIIHTYAAATNYNAAHYIVNDFGCKDTVVQIVTVLPKPICVLSYTNPTTFCSNDSLVITACAGYTNYQWYNNGILIPTATNTTHTATTNGNYYLQAIDPVNGCTVLSDTIAVTVYPASIALITQSDSACEFKNIIFTTPSCANCIYAWTVDNFPVSTNTNIFDTVVSLGFPPVSVHTINVIVTNQYGCVSTDSLVVNIYPNPTLVVTVSGPLPICGNNIYTISAVSSAALPVWNWIFAGFSISNNDTILANTAGAYIVKVKDGTSGCTATYLTTIAPSPDLSLFPTGCDTLCDTCTLALPIPSVNFNIAGYTVNWYNNAPPYTPIFTGSTILLGSLPFNTNHQLSVIVTGPNGCTDTSNVYDFYLEKCSLTPLSIHGLILNGSVINDDAQLYWLSINNDITNSYSIYKSIDGINFDIIQHIKQNQLLPNGTNYQLQNNMNNSGKTTWYKVAQYFADGTVANSNIVALQSSNTITEQLIVSPSVATNATIAYFTSAKKQSATIKIMNNLGQLVLIQNHIMQQGINTIPIDVSAFASGTYQVIIQSDFATYVNKLIKQ